MKILFFGRGVISTQYAWAFERAGHTVEFYVRNGRKEQYGSHVALEMIDARKSMKGTLIHEQWPVVFHEDIQSDHDYDLIFVSVNTHQIRTVVDFLSTKVGNATVLFFNNFWEDPVSSVFPIPISQVVFGFPGAGGGFVGNTLKGGFMKTVFFSKEQGNLSEREKAVRDLFNRAGFKTRLLKDMRSWLWNHHALNAAMENEVMKFENYNEFMDSTEALGAISPNVKELIPLLKARGAQIDISTKAIAFMPPVVSGLVFGKIIFARNSFARKIMVDNNSETGHALNDMIVYAEKYGITLERLKSRDEGGKC